MMDDGLSVCIPDDPTGNAKLMFSILECLSKSCRNTVLFLMDHIKLVHLNADRNKMSSQALAICFGPLFSCHPETESLHKAIQVFKFLLDIWPHRKGSFNFMHKLDEVKTKGDSLAYQPTNKNSAIVMTTTTTTTAPSGGSSMIMISGGKSVPIQISERNPFRGLVGSMNSAATEKLSDLHSMESYRGYGSLGLTTTSNTTSVTSTFYDLPAGSRYTSTGATRSGTSSSTAVTTSISWISSSSGSSGGGRILPSTHGASRTISSFITSTSAVPQTSTYFQENTRPIGSYRYSNTLTNTTSTYETITSSSINATTTTSSSNYEQMFPEKKIDAEFSNSSYLRANHTSSSNYDSLGLSSYSRPHYSSNYSSLMATDIATTTSSTVLPIADVSSPSRQTTFSSAYLMSNSAASEAIYSTVNKPGRTTDLHISDVFSSSSILKRGIAHSDDNYSNTNFRSSSLLDRCAATSATTTTNSDYSSWTSADTSGIGSKYRSIASDDHSTSIRSYLPSYMSNDVTSSTSNQESSPPLGKAEFVITSKGFVDKPLIGAYGSSTAGLASSSISTQLYPTKLSSASTGTSLAFSTTSGKSLYSSSLESSGYSGSGAEGLSSLERTTSHLSNDLSTKHTLTTAATSNTTNITGSYRTIFSNI